MDQQPPRRPRGRPRKVPPPTTATAQPLTPIAPRNEAGATSSSTQSGRVRKPTSVERRPARNASRAASQYIKDVVSKQRRGSMDSTDAEDLIVLATPTLDGGPLIAQETPFGTPTTHRGHVQAFYRTGVLVVSGLARSLLQSLAMADDIRANGRRRRAPSPRKPGRTQSTEQSDSDNAGQHVSSEEKHDDPFQADTYKPARTMAPHTPKVEKARSNGYKGSRGKGGRVWSQKQREAYEARRRRKEQQRSGLASQLSVNPEEEEWRPASTKRAHRSGEPALEKSIHSQSAATPLPAQSWKGLGSQRERTGERADRITRIKLEFDRPGGDLLALREVVAGDPFLEDGPGEVINLRLVDKTQAYDESISKGGSAVTATSHQIASRAVSSTGNVRDGGDRATGGIDRSPKKSANLSFQNLQRLNAELGSTAPSVGLRERRDREFAGSGSKAHNTNTPVLGDTAVILEGDVYQAVDELTKDDQVSAVAQTKHLTPHTAGWVMHAHAPTNSGPSRATSVDQHLVRGLETRSVTSHLVRGMREKATPNESPLAQHDQLDIDAADPASPPELSNSSDERSSASPPAPSNPGRCPLCMEDLSDLGVSGSRQHVERCLDETEKADMTANVQDPDRKKSRSYAGIISGKDRPPPDLFLPGRTALNIPTLSVNVVDSDLPISIFEPRELNDVVEDEDLPSPYVDESLSSEEAPAEFPVDDVGSSRKLRPLTDPAKFLAALEDPDGRTTAALYEITENAANVLKEWQDEWMEIENRVARATQAKPRDPRAPIDPVTYEDQKEAALYGFRWDPHPAKRGNQDPFTQKRGLVVGGKELRRRDESSRRWGLESDDAAAQEPGSRGRPRRARMGGLLGQNDAAGSGIDTGRSSRAPTASTVRATGTPELTVPKKRGRPRLNNLPTRVNDLRAAPSGASTETEASASLATPAPAKRRGRPPKHLAAARGGAPAKRGRKRKTGEISSSGPPHRDGEEPKQRVKSAKRSAAMQLWWNTRKGLAGGKKDGGEERAGSGLEAAESGATARQETPLGPSPEAPAPRRKGRPPGKKGRRGVEGLKSERVVDSAADESDARSTPRPGAGAEPHGDGLTEFERFQKLSSGGGVGLGPGRRRRGWVGAVDEGARDAGEVDEEDEEGEDEEGDEVEEEFHVDDGTSWDEY